MPGETREEEKPYLTTETDDLKIVSDYTGLNFVECLELDCVAYKALFRDALIHKLRSSPEGQRYLEDCCLLQQDKPDRAALQQFKERR